MKRVEPTSDQRAFRDELIAVLRKYPQLRPDEMLAVASYFVGQLVAMQDQRKLTPSMAMAIVGQNIEAGNAQVLKELTGAAPGGSA